MRALEDPGTVVASYDYCPTGNDIGTTGTVPNPFRQAGGEYDPGTKQYHTANGYYDPTQGVYSQASFATLGFSYTLPSAAGLGGAAADVVGGSLCALSGLCEALATGVGIAVVGATGYEIYQHRAGIAAAASNVLQFAGKGFKGGSQGQRDRTYGVNDKAFWDWWHRAGKRQAGGQDIQSREEAQQEYEQWNQLGRPRAPKG